MLQDMIADRIFTIFEQNEDGNISVDEYTETLRRITNKDNLDEAIRFLFKIYDANGTQLKILILCYIIH